MVNDFYLLTISTKKNIVDAGLGYSYALIANVYPDVSKIKLKTF